MQTVEHRPCGSYVLPVPLDTLQPARQPRILSLVNYVSGLSPLLSTFIKRSPFYYRVFPLSLSFFFHLTLVPLIPSGLHFLHALHSRPSILTPRAT